MYKPHTKGAKTKSCKLIKDGRANSLFPADDQFFKFDVKKMGIECNVMNYEDEIICFIKFKKAAFKAAFLK